MKKASAGLLVFFLVFAGNVYSGGMPRSILTKDTQPLGEGHFWGEAGLSSLKASDDAKFTDVFGSIGFGVTPQWDVFALFPYSSVDNSVDESGMGDITLSTSYELTSDELDPFGSSLGLRVKLPAADEDKGLGTGEADYTLSAGCSAKMLDALGFFNISYTYTGDPGSQEVGDYLKAVAECQVPITPGSNFSVALTGMFPDGDENNQYEILGGVDYYFNEMSKLNILAGTGLDNNSPDVRAGFSISMLF